MISIVRLRESHIPSLLELWKEFMDFHSDINPYFIRGAKGHRAFEKHVREIMSLQGGEIFVAMDGERVVGYALLQLIKPPPVYDCGEYGFISDMAVASGYRRQGVGEKLLQRSMAWFQSKKVHTVELGVITGNEVGQSFWKKQGFAELMVRMSKDI